MDAHRPTIVLKLTAFDPIVHIAETLSPTGHRRWHLECAGCRKAMQQVLEPEKRVHGGLIHARAVPARCLSSIDQTSAIDTVAQPNKQCKQPPYHVHSKLPAPSSRLPSDPIRLAPIHPGALFPSSRIPASCRPHDRSGQPAASEDQERPLSGPWQHVTGPLGAPKLNLISRPAHYASSCLSII